MSIQQLRLPALRPLLTALTLSASSLGLALAQGTVTALCSTDQSWLPGVNYPELSASTILSGAVGR